MHADRRAELLAWAFLTRRGQLASLAAGLALWAVAWPLLVPAVATAVVCDAIDSRKARKEGTR
jgi:Na+/proline symporter